MSGVVALQLVKARLVWSLQVLDVGYPVLNLQKLDNPQAQSGKGEVQENPGEALASGSGL